MPYDADKEYHDKMMQIISENHYRVCEMSGIKNLDIDMGLSVNYHKIIGEDILCHCKKGFYNIHHSYNLRLRGRNITTHAILNTLNENICYHGTCLHRMISKLDAGPIIASRAVSIEEDDTAYSLFQKADMAAFEMAKEWLPRIAFQEVMPYNPPEAGIHNYRDRELPDRSIDLSIVTGKELSVWVRAFDYPGKEPAFFYEDGCKKHLVFRRRDSYVHERRINGDLYFTE